MPPQNALFYASKVFKTFLSVIVSKVKNLLYFFDKVLEEKVYYV